MSNFEMNVSNRSYKILNETESNIVLVLLPRLAVVVATNNHETDANVKQSVAVALFEAYSALSCCFLNRSVILESFLPGAKSLYRDLGPEHANIIASIIRDFETKVTMERFDRFALIKKCIEAAF